jgi:starch-binding outer membrane protein, SusD/RagB family
MRHLLTYMTCLLCTCGLLLCLAMFSCKKFVDVPLPVDKVTSEALFQTDEAAASAIRGLYTQMMPVVLFYSSGGTTIYTGLMSDELNLTNAANATEMEFASNNLSAANRIVSSNFWIWSYKIIYQANACIENLSKAPNLTPAVKNNLLGQAKLIRGFTYFYLLNLFGEVPLVISTEYTASAALPRATKEEVWLQITSDCKEAKTLLPTAQPSGNKGVPGKWAAAAMLARTYLYQNNWSAAENEATEIINSGQFTLLSNLGEIFLANSDEAIWQLAPAEPLFNTNEPRFFIPTKSSTSRPAYTITSELLNAFEAGDQRKTAWVGSKTVAGEIYNYAWKYKIRDIGLPLTEYNMVIRYAEILLIRAEAKAHLNKLDEAIDDLNLIRSRAGLPLLTIADQASLLKAIEHERRIELFAEWGHRWFDLKRTGRATEILAPLKLAWKPSAMLFPIPQNERLRNPLLTQNPGY